MAVKSDRCARLWIGAFAPTGAAEIGVARTMAAVPLWVHLSLTEECRGRVERALSGPAESRDARRNVQLYAALCAALFLTKGLGPETVAAWTSSFDIAESLDDADVARASLEGQVSRTDEHVAAARYCSEANLFAGALEL